MGIPVPESLPGESLLAIAAQPDDPGRVVFSEYHAAGAESAAYMVRQGKWKLIYYVGMDPQLFDLDSDPEELHDLASGESYSAVVEQLKTVLRTIVDPKQQDAIAKDDQRKLLDEQESLENS